MYLIVYFVLIIKLFKSLFEIKTNVHVIRTPGSNKKERKKERQTERKKERKITLQHKLW